ncbi:HAD hydrolase family protein [Pendulispora brunnea]|uniref:HAD hydrolase family protein n=1 Tax=Pendulispora brunnea TaxID=2905690 RepID=A0ABZ2KEI6_9BACT
MMSPAPAIPEGFPELRDIPRYPVWLATDLDGTYLVHSDHPAHRAGDDVAIAAQTRLNEVVRRLNEQGILGIIVTTGRAYAMVERIRDRIAPADLFVTGDGRYVCAGKGPDAGKPMASWEALHRGFDAVAARDVFASVGEELGIPFLDYAQAFPERVGDPSLRPAEGQISRYVPVARLEAGVTVEDARDRIREALLGGLRERGSADTVLFSVDESRTRLIFRIKPPMATKEGALAVLLRELGVQGDRLIVAGDNYNDETMLKEAERAILAGDDPTLCGLRDALKGHFEGRHGARWDDYLYRLVDRPSPSILEGILFHLQRMDVGPSSAQGPLACGLQPTAGQVRRMQARLTETLQERGVLWGHKLLPTFVLPYFMPAHTLKDWAGRAEAVVAAVERLARAALADRDLYARLKLDPLAEELVRTPHGYDRIVPVARPDALTGAGDPVFIELNCDCPGLVTYSDMLTECMLDAPELAAFRDRAIPENRTERLLATLLDCYRQFGGTANPPTIAIAGWDECVAHAENQAIACRFRAAGYPTVVCDLRRMRRSGSHLEVDGLPIQLVYRRAPFRELFARRADIEPFLRAYRDGIVCVVNPLCSYIASSKAALAILCEESPNAGLLPRTTFVDPEQNGEWRQRGSWVLKRAESAAAEHVLLPKVTSDEQWSQALARAKNEVWVAQKICPIPYLEIPSCDEGTAPERPAALERWFFNWNPFVFGGRYAGSFVCASNGPLINQVKGGTVIPVVPYHSFQART